MLKRLLPDTLAGRTIVILLFSLGLFHLWSLWIYQLGVADVRGSTREEQLAARLASVQRVIMALPETEREHTARAFSTETMEIQWSRDSAVPPHAATGHRIALVRQRLGEMVPEITDTPMRLAFGGPDARWPTSDAEGGDDRLVAAIELPDGSWLNFSVAKLPMAAASDHGVLGSLTAMALGILLVSVFLVRSVTAPLRSLAEAADRIGIDAGSPDLPLRGPREVRQAANAFNRMQTRIKRLIEDRTQTLAAVSHDLKTPITRLRLRAQFVGDEDLRQTIETDLDEMEAMISSTLAFLRGDASGEEIRTVDLATILETVCDHLLDGGHDVALQAAAPAPLRCRPLAIKRALSNLAENAVKYGRRAQVSLQRRDEDWCIAIRDDGPGIPPAELDRVFDPFYRLETSRSRETGGTGLGLTVARSTIRAHGGDITLANHPDGGLQVTVTLPLAGRP